MSKRRNIKNINNKKSNFDDKDNDDDIDDIDIDDEQRGSSKQKKKLEKKKKHDFEDDDDDDNDDNDGDSEIDDDDDSDDNDDNDDYGKNYLKLREERIKQNQAVLASLSIPSIEKKKPVSSSSSTSATRKRKQSASRDVSAPPMTRRRSSRLVSVADRETMKQEEEERKQKEKEDKAREQLERQRRAFFDYALPDAVHRSFRDTPGVLASTADWTEFQQMSTAAELAPFSYAAPVSTFTYQSMIRVGVERIHQVDVARVNAGLLIASADRHGNVGVWCQGRQSLLCVFPHRDCTGLAIHKSQPTFVVAASPNGHFRVLDFEKQLSVNHFPVLAQPQTDPLPDVRDSLNSVCLLHGQPVSMVGTMHGDLLLLDLRERLEKPTKRMKDKHGNKRVAMVKTVETNDKLVVSSGNDGRALLFDLRKDREPLVTVEHARSVTGVDVSPDGKHMLTTSHDDTIRITAAVSGQQLRSFSHDNQTGRWISNFHAIWLDNESFAVGGMRRTFDVGSLTRFPVVQLRDPRMTTIPAVIAYEPSTHSLIGAAASGKTYVFA